VGLVCAVALGAAGCGSHRPAKIAVIPQTEGTGLWEAAHTGAEEAADRSGVSIYWNAPTREDDVEAQITLVDRVSKGDYQGLAGPTHINEPVLLYAKRGDAVRRGHEQSLEVFF
jgi:ABC-type sugar transport system substrate-binding protein